MFLSRLNEISGDCEKIVLQCYILKLPGIYQEFASKMNEMKYPTTKRDSPLKNNFKNFQQTKRVEILFL